MMSQEYLLLLKPLKALSSNIQENVNNNKIFSAHHVNQISYHNNGNDEYLIEVGINKY